MQSTCKYAGSSVVTCVTIWLAMGQVETVEEVVVKVNLAPGAVAPEYATTGSAGLDLCSIEDCSLEPLERKRVGTGVRVSIPPGFEGQVRARSGLAMNFGVGLVNSIGTIDSDYRGEIGVLLINFGRETVHISQGQRIAQLVICPVARANIRAVDEFPLDTHRGEGGFGSTGR